MEWHINELSLEMQFLNPQDFKNALEPVLKFRCGYQQVKNFLYCSRHLCNCQVTANADFQHIVFSIKDHNFRRLVLEWVAKSGPFWDDERAECEDDLFLFEDNDVTNLGLGEAARRNLVDIHAFVFSFYGKSEQFKSSPISITHGLLEKPIAKIDIPNHWEISQVISAIEHDIICCSWKDVQTQFAYRYKNLLFSADALEKLYPTPFSEGVSQRIFERLEVLEKISEKTLENGDLSEKGMLLYSKHFVGEKAWFTDESITKKRKFDNQLTFFDPEDKGKVIVCSWHGKIKTPQIRIHFEWPRPKGQKIIKITYIGPKITKD